MKITHKTQATTAAPVRREHWNEEHEIEDDLVFGEEVAAPGVQATGKITLRLPNGTTVCLMTTSPDE